ncbi:hypothetical protein O6H91_01G175600 [Diphasiastrum complanatum]|uniref:Uncharacterized protein n=1 Tax=Diphasiastrum complanatum TaxID=34168 RepID=A0ACC2EZ94_DIPCM|nr:hypothetical protein O6H91_01G175600 [Diphasiastrum complanatum]
MLRAAGFCSLMDWRSLGVVWWMVPFWWFALAWSWRSFCGVVSLVCYFFGCFDRCLLLVLPVYNSPSFGLGCIAPWFVLLGPSLWWWLMLRVAPKAVELPESGALVLPMAKDSFLVGILVAEWLSHKPEKVKLDGEEEEFLSVSPLQQRARLIPSTKGTFDMEHPTELIQTARCLALACVLDQRAVLLQQSSWKKGVRIDNLFEQAQGPLTTIRTLGKMLLPMLKRGEISHDVVEDIIVQGDRMKDILRLIQENGARLIQLRQNVNAILENPRKPSRWGVFGPTIRSGPNLGELHNSLGENPSCSTQALASTSPPVGRDKELPMPPMTLAPLYNRNLRTCDVADVLLKLVKAANGLALTKNQTLQLNSPHAFPLIAAVEEDILHHALSRLLDGVLQHSPSGGWVRAEVMQAPGGGVLVLIEDNGPDMSVVMQAHILSPLGSGLKAFTCYPEEENATCNLGEEVAFARDFLETYGIVLRIKSPYLVHAPIGNGGIRLEIWLPVPPSAGDLDAE